MIISDIIFQNVPSVLSQDKSNLYQRPNIDDKRLNNAIKAMQITEDPNDILSIIDTSLFKNAKAGIVFTTNGMYVHEVLSEPKYMSYSNINDATLQTEINDKGKSIDSLQIELNDGSYSIDSGILDYINGTNLCDLLIKIGENHSADDSNATDGSNANSEESKITGTISSLESLPNPIKLDYIELICNFALQDDQQIDPKEYRDIISLAARIQLEQSDQIKLNKYLIDESHSSTSSLLQSLISPLNEETRNIINKSLMKDALNIICDKSEEKTLLDWKQNNYLCELAENLDLSTEQVNFIADSIIKEQRILTQRLNDSEIKKQTKDLVAKATAVGVPLAALYFSGSIVGVSAAGITSGLAAIGFGGVLGLSGMVTGIGVLILAGTATYKGVQKFTGRKDIENNKQRDALLQQIIRNTQNTLNYLIDNVNYVSEKLVDLNTAEEINKAKISKMVELLSVLSKGAQSTTSDLDYLQSESTLTSVPKTLNIDRLKNLTNKPTDKEKYDIVVNNYQMSDNGEMTLKPSIPLKDAEILHGILEQIQYNSVEGVTKSGLGSAKDAIKDLF